NFGRDPLRVVVGNINKLVEVKKNYNILVDKNKTIIFSPESPAVDEVRNILKDNVIIHTYKDRNIPFKYIFSVLAENYNITSVLVEGGGETVWRIIKENLVDDFIIFISPKIFGGRDAKTWVEGEGVKLPSSAYEVKFLTVEQIGEDFVIKAKISK
ncbi:MAG: dihydrofolate reductase family protein, partial [Endomicrobia bacterium]|nr:dihydrofolate reductase family protein [Endomicrobiia bacterium]